MIWVIYSSLVVSVVAVLIWVSRSKRAETVIPSYDAPAKIDTSDFGMTDKEAVVVLFSSSSCESCNLVKSKAEVLITEKVGVYIADYQDVEGKTLHEKYSIEAVPTLIVCDSAGVTQKAFLGTITATDLWAAVASVRGSKIEQCANH